MKKVILIFAACLVIFLLNMLMLNSGREVPSFFSSHLNDLLCLPIVLSICYFVIGFFSKKGGIVISLFSAFSLAALYSVYFEIYLPEVTTRYTADIIDVLLYFTGAFVFWLIHRTKKPGKIRQ